VSPDAGALPAQVGRFPVLALLGAGGFATVYRARDERLDADVAVKVLAENHAFNPEVRERFTLEGRLLRRVADPHVLGVHEVGQTDRGQPFLVLDLAEGGDLAARVRQARAAGWTPGADDLGRVTEAVCAALTSLHAARVVHRDLAPANLLVVGRAPDRPGHLLLDPLERLCVADLGLSKDLAAASGLTVQAGTAGFAPPEQRRSGGWVDPRADIWSASALLLWLATGEGPQVPGWRDRLAAAPLPAAVREGLARVLDRGLRDDPQERQQDVRTWREEVVRALAPAPPVLAPVSATRRPWWRPAVAAVLALALVATAFVLGRATVGSAAPRATTTVTDGRTEVRAVAGDASLVLAGPAEQPIGEPVELTVRTEGVEDLVWYAPDGQVHEDADRIEVTLTSPGTTRAVVVGRDADGRVLEASLPLRAVDP
jgi:hypothetical protein